MGKKLVPLFYQSPNMKKKNIPKYLGNSDFGTKHNVDSLQH